MGALITLALVAAQGAAPTNIRGGSVEGCSLRLAAPGVQATIERLADGSSVALSLERAPADLESQLATQWPPGTRAEVFVLPDRTAEVVATLPLQLSTPSVRRSSGGLEIELGCVPTEDSLRRRVLRRFPRSVPVGYVAPEFLAAERALQAARMDEAEQRYSALANEYALRSWAELRRADVALLRGEASGACGRYAGVAERFADRSAGLLALLRLRSLRCAQQPELVGTWAELWRRLATVDGAVGRYLREEARWTLETAVRLDDALAALAIADDRGSSMRLSREARAALVARAIRQGDSPRAVAQAFLSLRPALRDHPEASRLMLAGGRALLDLGLSREAVVALDQAASVVERERHRLHRRLLLAQILALLVEAHESSGQIFLSRQNASRYQEVAGGVAPSRAPPNPPSLSGRPPLQAALDQLEARLAMVSHALANVDQLSRNVETTRSGP